MNENVNDSRFYSEAFTDGATAGILRRTIIMAYLKAGETVYFGSSVSKSKQDINFNDTGKITGNDISVIFPNGTIKTYDVEDTGSKTGFIANATQEKMGPQFGSHTGSDYYNPLKFTAETEGTYTFRFHSVNGVRANPTERNTQGDFKSYSDSVNKDSQVAAWDITVVDSTNTVKTGRTWANYLSLNTGSQTAKSSLHVYVVTADSVIYKVDLNEISPWGFVFFANNAGFTTTDIVPKSVYHSFYDVSADLLNMNKMNLAVHLPNAADSESAQTFKLFFEEPSAEYLNTLQTVPSPEPITSVKFKGIDDYIAEEGSGGEFIFDTKGASTAELIFDFSTLVPASYKAAGGTGIVELNGPVKDGTNIFYWDGKDTAGFTIPSMAYDLDKILIKATPKLGEIHFPLIDVEQMDGGIVVERLNGGDRTDENKYNLYYNNYPLKTGSLTSATGSTGTLSMTTDGKTFSNKSVYVLPDGTMSYKISTSAFGGSIKAENIATLDEHGELKAINSNKTTMKYGSNGGNNAGIDIWTYYSPSDSTSTTTLDGGSETKLTIIAPSTPMGSISGRVFLDEDQNREYNVDGGDKTLSSKESGIEVELRSFADAGIVYTRTEEINGSSKDIVYKTTADIHGVYHFYGVPEGEYFVKVNIPDDKAYENTTENDGNNDAHRQEIIVVRDKETVAEDIGYSVDKDAAVHFTFTKNWGVSNPLADVRLRLFKVASNGIATPVAEDHTVVLNYDNDWTYTYNGMERDTNYYVEEYYTKFVDEEEVSVLIGRSPIFNTDDGYWKTGLAYKKDVASDEEKKNNTDDETRFYNLKFGFKTTDFNHYNITLVNDQAYDNKEYSDHDEKE
ncbi:MAG: hypothetical protein MJ150_01145 [Clostridia bacterium]|nr:hypothetical protein [Clostridia bacterium]